MSTYDNAIALIFARNAFYKRMHFLVLGALALATVVIGILLGILIHVLYYPTEPLYFPTDAVGRLIEDVPVDRPNMSREDVMKWTIEAVENTFTLDFINYRAQMQNSQKYFTDFGWRNYLDSLTASNNLNALLNTKMVFLAKVIEQPKIVTEGILGEAYAYRFDLSVLMTYMYPPFDAKSSFPNALRMTVVVQRLPILKSYKGLGIVQTVANLAFAPPQAELTSQAPAATP